MEKTFNFFLRFCKWQDRIYQYRSPDQFRELVKYDSMDEKERSFIDQYISGREEVKINHEEVPWTN